MDSRYKLAAAQRLAGDIARRQGNVLAARSAWQSAFTVLPRGVAERPSELSERSGLLRRLGRGAEARPIEARLAAMGFRQSI
jgi:hypothetical protein